MGTVDKTTLDNKYNSFITSKSSFKTNFIQRLQNGYFYNSGDSQVQSMAYRINHIAVNIENAYNEINLWWNSYLKDFSDLESSLANSKNYSTNSILRNQLSTFVTILNDKQYNTINIAETSKQKVAKKVGTAVASLSKVDYNSMMQGLMTELIKNGTVTETKKPTKKKKTKWQKFKGGVKSARKSIGNAVVSTTDWFLYEPVDEKWKDVKHVSKKTGAAVANGASEILITGTDIGEGTIDILTVLGTGIESIGIGAYDLAKGDTNFSTTKKNWKNNMSFVEKDYSGKLENKYYNDTKFGKWVKDNSIIYDDISNLDDRLLLTGCNFCNSFSWGLGKFGENLIDGLTYLGTGILTPFSALADGVSKVYYKLPFTKGDYHSKTAKMWNRAKKSVEYDIVETKKEEFYKNNEDYIDKLKNESYAYKTTDTVGNMAGYMSGAIITSGGVSGILGKFGAGTSAQLVGGALMGGISGSGKGSEIAWQNNASISEGIISGAIQGLSDFALFYIGGKAGQTVLGNGVSKASKVATLTFRTGVDAASGAVMPLFPMIEEKVYTDKSFKQIFKEQGGWTSIITSAGISGGLSFVNTMKEIKSGNLEINKAKQDFEKRQEEIDRQIKIANRSGEATVIEINSLNEISKSQLENIENPENILFKIGDKTYNSNQIKEIMNEINTKAITSQNRNIENNKFETSAIDIQTQIDQANIANKSGHFMSIDLNSLDEITYEDLMRIDNPDNVIFRFKDGTTKKYDEVYSNVVMKNRTIKVSNIEKNIQTQIDRANIANKSGHFMSIDLNSLDEITYEDLMRIDNPDNVIFRLKDGTTKKYDEVLEYKKTNKITSNTIQETNRNKKIKVSKIMKTLDFNKNNLIEGIIDEIPENLDELSKARVAYLKLNQSVSYSDEYVALSKTTRYNSEELQSLKNNIVGRKINIADIGENNQMVCSTWSYAYKDILVGLGIDESKITIIGENSNKLVHHFVTVDLGNGKTLVADGTQNFSNFTDLANSKFGQETLGFKIMDSKEISGITNARDLHDMYWHSESEMYYESERTISEIDKKIGYSNAEYKKSFDKILKKYKNSSLNTKIDKRIEVFMDIFNNKNQGAVEQFPLLQSYLSILKPDFAGVGVNLYIKDNTLIDVVSITNRNTNEIEYLVKIGDKNLELVDNVDEILKGAKKYR